MRKRTAFLIYSSFILILVIIFPMRGIVSLVDDKDIMRINSIEGFWWKGTLEGVVLEDRSLGDIQINFSPVSLIKGKFGFKLDLIGPELDLKGIVGFRANRDLFIENTNLVLNPKLKDKSGKTVLQNFSNIKANIKSMRFNDEKCISADGSGTGEMIDVFGLIPQKLKINLELDCKDDLFEISFQSNPENVLEGEVVIKPNLEYNLEARSKRLSNKIIEATKLNFKKEPSFRISGRLDEL